MASQIHERKVSSIFDSLRSTISAIWSGLAGSGDPDSACLDSAKELTEDQESVFCGTRAALSKKLLAQSFEDTKTIWQAISKVSQSDLPLGFQSEYENRVSLVHLALLSNNPGVSAEARAEARESLNRSSNLWGQKELSNDGCLEHEGELYDLGRRA